MFLWCLSWSHLVKIISSLVIYSFFLYRSRGFHIFIRTHLCRIKDLWFSIFMFSKKWFLKKTTKGCDKKFQIKFDFFVVMFDTQIGEFIRSSNDEKMMKIYLFRFNQFPFRFYFQSNKNQIYFFVMCMCVWKFVVLWVKKMQS